MARALCRPTMIATVPLSHTHDCCFFHCHCSYYHAFHIHVHSHVCHEQSDSRVRQQGRDVWRPRATALTTAAVDTIKSSHPRPSVGATYLHPHPHRHSDHRRHLPDHHHHHRHLRQTAAQCLSRSSAVRRSARIAVCWRVPGPSTRGAAAADGIQCTNANRW